MSHDADCPGRADPPAPMVHGLALRPYRGTSDHVHIKAMLVGSHNPNHAMELYLSVGYRALRRDTLCRKPLT